MSKSARIAIGVFIVSISAAVLIAANKITPNGSGVPVVSQDPGLRYGIAGYTPANGPDAGVEDGRQYWVDISRYSDIYGVHVDWQELTLVHVANAQLATKPLVVVLGFQTPDEWETSVEGFIQVASQMLTDYPQIEYLGIGNEVNVLQKKYPENFAHFVAAYQQIYSNLRENFPKVKMSPTFQYEEMVGRAYLVTGKVETDSQLSLLEQFEPMMDMVAITTYPYFAYQDPENIPLDYFTQISEYTTKPIVITETGWMARKAYAPPLEGLQAEGYTGSESEQDRYLEKLIYMSELVNIDVVNWAFLNDIGPWKNGGAAAIGVELFDSIALHDNEGRAKVVWERWKKIFGE
jgi:exo-beta-1,3-glucanase (GH17 family)